MGLPHNFRQGQVSKLGSRQKDRLVLSQGTLLSASETYPMNQDAKVVSRFAASSVLGVIHRSASSRIMGVSNLKSMRIKRRAGDEEEMG